MPELPEVEVVCRALRQVLDGAVITGVPVARPPRWSDAAGLVGGRVQQVSRRGKYAMLGVVPASGPDPVWLVVHLGMTGRLLLADREALSSNHLRMHLVTDRSEIALVDPRGFGFARTATPAELLLPPWSKSTFGRLGADPLEDSFDASAAAARLRALSGGQPVKALLLDQRAVAGVGNYIADEACWRARVHPAARALSATQARKLVEAVRDVMRESVEAGGVSVRDYRHVDGSLGTYAAQLRAYGRAGEACLRCSRTLTKGRVASRGTTWCPSCQRAQRPG